MKKLEVLHKFAQQYGYEVQVSKKGNSYIILESLQGNIERYYTAFSVTKNTLHKIGTKIKYNRTLQTILILGQRGFLYKDSGNYQLLTYKIVANNNIRFPILKDLFFFNRKCEFLRHDKKSMFLPIKFLQSFTSWKEVKNYLGFTFINTEQFQKLDLALVLKYNQYNKQDVYKLVTLLTGNHELKGRFEDCKNMLFNSNTPLTKLPTSIGAIDRLHDQLVYEANLADIESKNDLIIPTKSFNKDVLAEFNPIYLESEKDLFIHGIEQHHCVGSRYSFLGERVYFYIEQDNKKYTFELAGPNFEIHECKAKYNHLVPQPIFEEIGNKIKDEKKRISINNYQLTV